MNLGQALLWITTAATATTIALYLPSVLRPRGNRALRPARWALAVSALGLVLSSALLWTHLLRHEFRFDYVYRYASLDMPLRYVISAFWGGQEGTFLLWALMSGLLAVYLRFTARSFEAPVLAFYLGIPFFLMLMMLKRSPFAELAVTPPDGQGLNPLLQDPWMTIHPPIVFFGFAALGIPAAYAMAALVRKDWDGWVRPALPWTLFGILSLGAGLTLGGYWAYSILGWGGFWGWDPVENSSLVPWLFAVAVLHTLLLQRHHGRFRRLNLFLALVPFLFLTYSTFLTRSGVLADFSVHSFTDLGINQFLALFMIVFAGGGLALFAARFRAIPLEKRAAPFWSRDYFLYLGSMAFILFGLVVLLGTSAPLFTRLWGAPSTVQPEFYNRAGLPFAVLIGALLGVAPFLFWSPAGGARWNRLAVILGLTALGAVGFFLAGMRQPGHLLMAAAGLFAVLAHGPLFVRRLLKEPRTVGGHLAHLGTGLCVIGMLTSTAYTVSETVVLPLGQEVTALGYGLTYTGHRPIEGGRRTVHDVTLRTAGGTSVLSPAMFPTPQQGMMKKPAIRSFATHDVYLAPVEGAATPLAERVRTRATLEPDTRVTVLGMTLTLRDIATEAEAPHDHGGEMMAATLTHADIAVEIEGSEVVVVPEFRTFADGHGEVWGASVKETGYVVILTAADAATGRVDVEIEPPALAVGKGETALLEGASVTLLGFDVSLGEQVEMMAVAQVALDGRVHDVRPGLIKDPDSHRFTPREAPVGDTGRNLVLDRVDANAGIAYLRLVPAGTESLVAEISRKPFILVLWAGTGLALLGLVVAVAYRSPLAQREFAYSYEARHLPGEMLVSSTAVPLDNRAGSLNAGRS